MLMSSLYYEPQGGSSSQATSTCFARLRSSLGRWERRGHDDSTALFFVRFDLGDGPSAREYAAWDGLKKVILYIGINRHLLLYSMMGKFGNQKAGPRN